MRNSDKIGSLETLGIFAYFTFPIWLTGAALLAGKIACPQSFVRRGNIGLTKPLPLVRTDIEFPVDHALFTKEVVSSSTELNRLVTCSYPESDPKEIMHIPVVREGQ